MQENKKDNIQTKREDKESFTQIQQEKYHQSDMLNYKMKHPDFSEALKGRTLTLNSFK